MSDELQDLIERLQEMAGLKYQFHTGHAPAVMNEAAAELSALRAERDALQALLQEALEGDVEGAWYFFGSDFAERAIAALKGEPK